MKILLNCCNHKSTSEEKLDEWESIVGFCSQDKNAFRKYLGKKKQLKHLIGDLGGYNSNFFYFFFYFPKNENNNLTPCSF